MVLHVPDVRHHGVLARPFAVISRLAPMVGPVHRSGLSLFLGAFALLGLFAMHGLGGHGMNHAGASEPHQPLAHAAAATVEMAQVNTTGHGGAVSAHEACDGACATGRGSVHGPTGSGSGDGVALVMVLCLAVLTAAAAIAVLAFTRTSVTVVGGPDLLRSVHEVLRGIRDRDPPSIYVLSVQRC